MIDIIDMRPNGDDLIDLAKMIYDKAKRKLNMIEIGSYQGQSMEFFASTTLLDTIICIDPWQCFYDNADPAAYTDMMQVERLFDNRMQFMQMYFNIVKHKGTIDTFVQSIDFAKYRQNIDFVYIDALHTYDGCKHDIDICQKYIKPKIAYAGHDYVDGWAGVKKAVNEMLGVPDKTFEDGSWMKFV